MLYFAEGAQQNILLPASYDLLWGAISFLLVAWAVGKYGVPKITALLDERAAKIQEGLEFAQRAEDEMAQTQARIAKELGDARREAAQVRESATAEGKAIVTAARAKAQEEADRITANAQRQIEAEVTAAQVALRADVGMLATELAAKIVGESLTEQALASRVIDRFLDDLEGAKTVAGSGEK